MTNCKVSKAMAYKHRSGSFRKVQYSLPIIRQNDLPAKCFKELLETANHIKAAEKEVSSAIHVNQQPEPDTINTRCKSKNLQNKKTVQIKRSEQLCSLKGIPVPDCSFVKGKDLYGISYADNKMPPFPIKTNSTEYFPSSDSSAAPDQEDYDYDMDSEDEEWLENNKKYHITPNRFEYIFAKLNKRNTHVPEKAIGALSSSFHPDFHQVFPYWKEKRLQNKNLSTYTVKQVSREAKSMSGYIPTDPYVVFGSHVPKPCTYQTKPYKKGEHQEATQNWVNSLTELRQLLAGCKMELTNNIPKCIETRNKVKNKLAAFETRYENLKLSSGYDEDIVDPRRRSLRQNKVFIISNSSNSLKRAKAHSAKNHFHECRGNMVHLINSNLQMSVG